MCTNDGSNGKKFAIPIVVLFELGWLLYTRGLGLAVESGVLSVASPLLLPFYPASILGQLVVLVILLRVLLPPSPISRLVGALSTSLNNLCLLFVGYSLVGSKYEKLAVSENVVMFKGAILLTVSLGSVQLLHVFDRPQYHQSRSLWYAYSTRTAAHLQWFPWRHLAYTEKVRFLSSLAIVVSAIGCMASICGRHKVDPEVKGDVFMEMLLMYTPPVLYIAALLHACSSGKVSITAHIIAAVLSSFYIVSIGYLIVSSGQYICCYYVVENSARLELYGGSISVISWTLVLILWPFYYPKRELTKVGHANRQGHSKTAGMTSVLSVYT